MLTLHKRSTMLLSFSMLLLPLVRGLLISSVTGSLLGSSASAISWLPQTIKRRQILKKPLSDDYHVLRGGESSLASPPPTIISADDLVRQYLQQDATKVRQFHIQGWRWHTMSVAREAKRLQKLAQRIVEQPNGNDNDNLESLQKAADYVVDFNLKALHRVENMFFPWIRQRMEESNVADATTKRALRVVMEELQQDQKKLACLGESITLTLKTSSASSTSPKMVAQRVATQSCQLHDLTQSMLEREISHVIPVVGQCVPEKEQMKFNNQVIKFLGVLDARTHLVHMHEVVANSKDKAIEQQLWEECIPALPRSLIPRWKRTLYEPRAGVLNGIVVP